MRVFKVNLGYIWDVNKPEGAEQLAKRKANLAQVGVRCEDPNSSHHHVNDLVVSGEALLTLQALGERVEEIREVDISHNVFSITDKQKILPPEYLAYNSKCEVHVTGFALMTYNETLLLEDSCTDALQIALDKGWRIIAACPQPNGRRPDYILGRHNPSREVGASNYTLREA